MQITKLIIFDCDGVLVDSEAISATTLVQELAKFDIALSRAQVFERFVGRSLTDVAEILQIPSGAEGFGKLSSAYYTALMAAFTKDLKAMHGIHEVLSCLNVASCVATSSSRQRVSHALAVTGLDRMFGKNVFTASQVENGKPAPDLFHFAAQEMGVRADECLVIEDSLPGVHAAQAAHMRVWRFTGGAHFAKDFADATTAKPDIPTFDAWADFFKLDPNLKAKVN